MTWYSSEMPLPPCMSRASRAISSALPQLLRLSSEIAGGAALPSSSRRPSRSTRVQAERDLGLHVGELLLHQLVGGERAAELLAVERVLPRAVPAEFGRAERAPGDAVARAVEAAERPGEALHVGQQVVLRDLTSSSTISPVIEARSENLPSIFGVAKPFAPRSTRKPRITPSSLAQTTRDVGDRRVGDPHLGAVEPEAVGTFSARVTIEPGSEPWSGSVRPKQPTISPVASLGRYSPLRLGAVREDRLHHERRLHRHGRAEAGIDPLELARDQAVAAT